jgi:uncharacterized delta-60 repeat protein
MKNYLLLLMLSMMIATPFNLPAQPAGNIDLSFADNGKFILDNGFTDLFTDVEVQDDGKIVAIGITYDVAYVASAQAIRFMPDGSIDDTFATDGIFTYSLNFEANVYGCAIRDNGKIVMAGSTTDYNDYRILIIQLNEDGSLDDSFGENGVIVQKVGPDINFFEDHGYAVTLQDDGMILVAGKSYNENYQFVPVVVRFTEGGQLDTEFGQNGVAAIPVTEVENDFDCLLVQDDDKIVASGHYANTFLSFAMLVARFLPDGTPDTSFGDNGIVNYPYSGVDDEGFGITMTSDNYLLVTGFTTTAGYNYSMLLMKFDPQGDLVPGFGTDGIVVADIGQYDVGYSMYVQDNDKILVAGTSGELTPGNNDMVVWRYNPDGTPDNTFGSDGMASIEFDGNPDEGLAMAHQEDGKIIIAGKAHNGSNFDYGMVRLLNDYATSFPANKESSLSVTPNPVSQKGSIRIRNEVTTAGGVRVDFINTSGVVTASVKLGYQNEGKHIFDIPIPDEVLNGMYFLRLSGSGNPGNITKLVITK